MFCLSWQDEKKEKSARTKLTRSSWDNIFHHSGFFPFSYLSSHENSTSWYQKWFACRKNLLFNSNNLLMASGLGQSYANVGQHNPNLLYLSFTRMDKMYHQTMKGKGNCFAVLGQLFWLVYVPAIQRNGPLSYTQSDFVYLCCEQIQ